MAGTNDPFVVPRVHRRQGQQQNRAPGATNAQATGNQPPPVMPAAAPIVHQRAQRLGVGPFYAFTHPYPPTKDCMMPARIDELDLNKIREYLLYTMMLMVLDRVRDSQTTINLSLGDRLDTVEHLTQPVPRLDRQLNEVKAELNGVKNELTAIKAELKTLLKR